MNSDLFVISAPSGAGKTTLARRLLVAVRDIEFSVSFTTRPKRDGEREGVDYHFVEPDEFERMLEAGEFLEWARVHGQSYGTKAGFVDETLARGKDVMLDVDTQGATSVKKLRSGAILIFILPPDFETLRKRLEGRGDSSVEEIERRLEHAREEIQRFTEYDYLVVNDDAGEALRSLEAIVRAHRVRGARQEEAGREIADGFRRE